jgi:hypothetical protein
MKYKNTDNLRQGAEDHQKPQDLSQQTNNIIEDQSTCLNAQKNSNEESDSTLLYELVPREPLDEDSDLG